MLVFEVVLLVGADLFHLEVQSHHTHPQTRHPVYLSLLEAATEPWVQEAATRSESVEWGGRAHDAEDSSAVSNLLPRRMSGACLALLIRLLEGSL